MEINNLNVRQLEQVISDASVALRRQKKIENATAEIKRISKKYKLSKSDLNTVLVSLQSSKAVPGRSIASRRKVEPKYQSEDGKKTWTGRGRSPVWVTEICRSEKLTLREFKIDTRFLI